MGTESVPKMGTEFVPRLAQPSHLWVVGKWPECEPARILRGRPHFWYGFRPILGTGSVPILGTDSVPILGTDPVPIFGPEINQVGSKTVPIWSTEAVLKMGTALE